MPPHPVLDVVSCGVENMSRQGQVTIRRRWLRGIDRSRAAPASIPAGVAEQTSARRTERGIALVVPAVRVVILAQILLGAASGTHLSDAPRAYIALTGAVVAVSLACIIQCLLTRSVNPGVWHGSDVVLAWLAIPAMNLLLPASQVVGTWEAWAIGYAVNVAAVASTWMRPSVAAVHGLTLGGWALIWLATTNATSWQTNVTNALTIPGYAIVIALLSEHMRALAADADRAREDAITATRALELERYQLTVHDASSILRLLSDETTPVEVLPGLRLQAGREAHRLRNYLGRVAPPGDPSQLTVGTMLATAFEGFDDLPLEPTIELGSHALLSPELFEAACGAVTTILHNVRLHAGASMVVVHADADGSTWEVVVSDDGRGFDQTRQPLGFGLHVQARSALADLGGTVQIASSLGSGTSVTITGPVVTCMSHASRARHEP